MAKMKIVSDLLGSPVLQALAVFLLIILSLFSFVPVFTNEWLDSLAIAGAIIWFTLYGTHAVNNLCKKEPNPGEMYVISSGLILFGIGGLRILRELGIDLGIISMPYVQFTFAMLSALMVFGVYMKIIAVPLHGGDRVLTPWAGLLIMLGAGTVLTIFIFILKWWLQ